MGPRGSDTGPRGSDTGPRGSELGRSVVRADDRQVSPQPVECARCAGWVEVVKFSPQHTSVQWTAAAVRGCAEFGARSAPIQGCAALRDSIDAALAAGRLVLSPPAYE